MTKPAQTRELEPMVADPEAAMPEPEPAPQADGTPGSAEALQPDFPSDAFAYAPDEIPGADAPEPGTAEMDLESVNERARPIPRISIQAFCEHQSSADAIQEASRDRRLAKAHMGIHMGGIAAARAHYAEAPTPNLIIIESLEAREAMLAELDRLAEVVDEGTKVIVIGHVNDVLLYRELLRRGVSEYLVAPITPLAIMESISNLYNDPESDPVGHVIAFIGAKGGCGSSTICHNTAFSISNLLETDVVIADLDLPFGTAGLDFNQDPVQGIADALMAPERVDEVLLDRLLSKCTDHLSLFAAPGTLENDWEITPEVYETVLDVVRQNVPYVTLDIPHVWNGWARQCLLQADEIVITALPDLASLRNAKNMVDLLRQVREHDRPPHLVLNQVGVPKRPEIPVGEFADALELEPAAVIEFDAETFGTAANNGQMIEEVSEKAKAVAQFRELAYRLANRTEQKTEEGRSLLAPLIEKLGLKRVGA